MHNDTTMHNDDATQAASTPPPGEQNVSSLLNEFCRDTALIACLAQANAVQFALIANRLDEEETLALVDILSQMSGAISQVVQDLEGALKLTWLCAIPEEQWGAAN